MSEIRDMTEDAGMTRFEGLSDAIIFFHKELCPHCKNMEKVLDKFTAKVPHVELYSVNSESRPELMKELGFERVPTLVFVRGGKVAGINSGIMNPRELQALYASI